MKKKLATLFLLASSGPALAMFCPGNFNQIALGDTIADVQQKCGQPNSMQTTKTEENGPQEWNYYATGGQQGSVKMAIAFNQGKIINISVNGISLASTQLCGFPISVGSSTITQVKEACGKPEMVNKSNQQDDASPPVETTQFHYTSTPPVTLIFVGGKLTARQ